MDTGCCDRVSLCKRPPAGQHPKPTPCAPAYTIRPPTPPLTTAGTDYRVADLGACTAPNKPAATCRVLAARDVSPDDNALDDNGHGTNVASIVAQAAPGVKIVALDVFRLEGGSWYGYDSDLLAAFDWVIANKDAYSICTINLRCVLLFFWGGGGWALQD